MTIKQKAALNAMASAVESTIRTLNKANPELMNMLVKDKLFKKQFYRYLEDVIGPKWKTVLESQGGNTKKAEKMFDTLYRDWIASQIETADMVKNPAITVNDLLDKMNPLYNSSHTAPKVSDITKGKPELK